MNDVTSPPNMGEYTFKGIWVQCSSAGVGMFSCDNFMRPVFSLSAMAIMQRSFIIFSVTGCAVTLALMIVGMECTKFYLRDPSKKVFMMKIAALVLELSAFCLLLVASIYAASLAQQFNNSMFYSSGLGSLFGGRANYDVDLIRYEFGACLYVAWIVSFCEIVLGILIYVNRGFQVN
ncbi:unnamed protein product [Oikopleura dioica]|uniref:Claudin n=1 Tax=Oikopleura dioica TaxID=34765 RepID=E4XLB5_OIKDI|nr:unnamed protein product [Oikopleura dioica]